MSMAGSSAVRGTGEPGQEEDDGDGWSRQLDRGEKVFWYGLAGVSYCVAGVLEKGLLNWFVGPLWLVAVIWFGPLLTDGLRHRWRARGAPR